MHKKTIKIQELEKRLMLDASLGALATPAVFGEEAVNAAPVILDSDVTVTGSTTDFDGESLTISTNGGADDQISINNEGTNAGEIGFDGTNVTYGGTLIGTISSDGTNGSNLTIDLNASASKASIERLIENLTYQNSSDNPTTTRTLNISLGVLFNENMDVIVVPHDETPSIANNGMTTNEGDTEVLTAAMLGITDPDNTNTEVTITITTAVTNGQLELTTNPNVAITSFTLDDLNNNRVVYIHDGSDTTSDSFDFTVTDGNTTTSSDTFNITINAVDDVPTLTTNAGTDVFVGDSVQIGGTDTPSKFGTVVSTLSGVGQHANLQGLVDNQNTQFSLIFTTPASTPNSVPGEVLFESGGSGRGIGLYLNNQNRLAWHIGLAQATPRLESAIALDAATQYAVIIEIDNTNDEVRMHYSEASDFAWFEFGRGAEATLTGYTDTDFDGGNGAGLGVVGSGSYGGFNGTISGTTTFQGSIDSDLILSRFPVNATTIENTKLITTDPDTTTTNIIYTITTDAADGELYNNGTLLSINDTFTQADLDNGLITYTHGGTIDNADHFIFSVSDGTTTLTNQTYNITVDVANDTPALTVQPFIVAEDASNGANVGTVIANDPDPGQILTYSITGGTGNGIFTINSSSGQITVLDNSSLDFETTTSYTLNIRATDNFGTPAFDEQTFTINVQDVYEGVPPSFTLTGPFNIDENSANNDDVGTVAATDGDGDAVTYSIVAGNTNTAFKINATTGLIEVNGNGKLDFETGATYTLTIRATDNSVNSEFTNQTVTININDLNEAPSLDIQTIIEGENSGVYYSTSTGNFYRYVNSNVNYNAADLAAQAALINGQAGHLVTITSAAENAFVTSIIGNHVWLAANDLAVEGEWRWVAGPENGIQFSQGGNPVNGMYERWNGSEPNTVSRDRAILHTNSRWYDEGNNSNRRYVIEWENGSNELINNNAYTISHTNADASDVALNYTIDTIQSYDDDGDTLEYTIQGGNTDGIFAIDINTGALTIADKTNLDASVTDTYTLTIRVQEQGAGLFSDKDITVSFDQAFTIAQNNAVTTLENGSVTIDNTDLQALDNDTAATSLVYTITTQPANGQLELTTAPGNAINSFTQDDIDNNRLTYVHNGSETLSDTFTFSITDGAETINNQNFSITVTPVNQGPSIVVNAGATVAEGGTVTIDDALLDGTDGDDADTDITYTASNYTAGHIEVSSVIQNTFTQDDVNNNRVVFVHDGSETNGSFDFSLADGGENSSTPATGTFSITKTDVNDGPVITTNTPATVAEGGTVVITTSELNATDPDDSGTGITYTLSNIENGFVSLSTNLGIPVLSFTSADLAAGIVTFHHGGSESNGTFDVTVSDGGEDGAGTNTATFTVNRTPVNDAPTVLINAGSSINQNSIVILKRAVLLAQDPDDNGSGISYTITATTNGQLEYLANPNVAITTFTQADIDNSLVIFRHSGPPGTADFDFTIADGGEDGAGTASGTFNLTVDNVNDAPSITTNSTPTFDEGSTNVITTAMLDSFDPDDFGTDLTWTISNVSNGYVELSTNAGTSITTFTQADLDAGIVRFVHDDSETTTASFDLSLADGGEDGVSADTGTFNITITPVNEGPTLVVNDGNPNIIDFNTTPVVPYDNFQDGQGGDPTGASASVDGSELTLTGNAWKKIDFVYTLTANTVLSFEFRADDLQEIHGIGFDNNTDFNDGVFGYQLAGSQVWSGMNQTFRTYQAGDGWVRFDIPVGADFTGAIQNLVFVMDDDATPTGTSFFRNVGFYESNQTLSMNEGGTFNITNSHINSVDVDDSGTGLTFTASNLSNGVVQVNGVTQNTFTQDDIDNNRVTFVHDSSDTLNAGFDISLADGGEDGVSADTGSFSIIVNPVDDAPTAATNNGISTSEGTTTTLTTAMLDTTDNDTANSQVIFTVTGALSNGQLELTTNPGTAINSFTLTDLQNNRVVYVHDGSETITDSFDFTIQDATTTIVADTFNITITPVNEGPSITTNTGANVTEGASVTITNAMLNASDVDDTATGLTYTASNYSGGHIEVSGVTQNTFTQDDINNNRVAFIHDGNETATASFDISLADGGEDGVSAATGTFNLTVTAVNDSPSITTNTGATMNEGASLTITTAMLNEGDVDDAGAGLTYTASNLTNGHIEVNGVTQNTFTQDDIDNNRVAFIHDGSETITASFDISLADGGENASVAASGTFNITITPTNDVPTLALNTGTTLAEGGVITLDNTMLSATDVESADASLIYTLTALPAGTFENTNTASVLNLGDTFTQADINNGFIRYTHDGGEGSSQTLSFTISDGSVASNVQDFVFSITPVNDAPTQITMTGGTIAENSINGTVVSTLSAQDADMPSDTLTYTILNDVQGLFSISGNQIIVSGSLDFEQMQSMPIQINVDDGNGGNFNETFTLSITDIDERTSDLNFFIPKEDEDGQYDQQRNQSTPLFFSGQRLEGFLGKALQEDEQNTDGRILKDNTTQLVHRLLEENTPASPAINISSIVQDSDLSITQPSSDPSDTAAFTTIEDALLFLEAQETSQNPLNALQNTEQMSPEVIDKMNIFEKELHSVISYQEEKQRKLMEALS